MMKKQSLHRLQKKLKTKEISSKMLNNSTRLTKTRLKQPQLKPKNSQQRKVATNKKLKSRTNEHYIYYSQSFNHLFLPTDPYASAAFTIFLSRTSPFFFLTLSMIILAGLGGKISPLPRSSNSSSVFGT